MIGSRDYVLLVGLIVLVCLAQPTLAFGAGNISSLSKIEGINWRHGDIEDVLLNIAMAKSMKGKKFSKLMVSRIYFGNWLRDYSQAVDVGTVKAVSAEAIRLVLCILSFLTFGYGSQEFEVTAERLGCYRPEEHIDNPKGYAENDDARRYDRRLRGPIDERRELPVDPETGMKNYIANERIGITTSAGLIRNLFGRCIELARGHARKKNNEDLYEAMRLMGTGLHCLEDFYAHSNYLELALNEMGERDVFAHVGRNTQINLQGARGPVWPLVTGSFGGVDFLHSVTGEVSDKLKQNELQELEGQLQESRKSDTSMLRNLLDKIPDSFFGGKHQSDKVDEFQQSANNSQMQNMKVSPREPEEFTKYVQNLFDQVMPMIQWHDDIMKAISSAFDKIPVLPKILEQLEEQLTMFIFSLLAPYILPLIQQIQNEMQAGSEGIVESSKKEQHIVFKDDNSTDPTHSMLSKDHFTNLLNEPGGRTASEMVKWVVPQLMQAIDDERVDINRTLDRIIYGVFHHPAQRHMGQDGMQEGRQLIFSTVEKWWTSMDRRQQDDYRRKLSREGVRNHENHKEGEEDTGHGHGPMGHLHMHKQFENAPNSWEDQVAGKVAGGIFDTASGAVSSAVEQSTGMSMSSSNNQQYQQQSGRRDDDKDDKGGFFGKASSLIGGVFGKDDKETSSSSRREDDGSYTQSRTEYAQSGNKYAQAQQSQTQYPSGGGRSEYRQYEQDDRRGGRTEGYGYEQRTETRPTQSGGYQQRTERQEYHGSSGGGGGVPSGNYGSSSGGYGGSSGGSYGSRRDDSGGYGAGASSGGYGRTGGGGGSGGYSGGRQEQSYGGSGGGGGRFSGGSSGGYGGSSGGPGGYPGSSSGGPGGYPGSGGGGGPGGYPGGSSDGRGSGGYPGSNPGNGGRNQPSGGRSGNSGAGYGGSSGGYGNSSGGYGGQRDDRYGGSGGRRY